MTKTPHAFLVLLLILQIKNVISLPEREINECIKKYIREYIQNKLMYKTLQSASMDVVSNYETGLQQEDSPYEKSSPHSVREALTPKQSSPDVGVQLALLSLSETM